MTTSPRKKADIRFKLDNVQLMEFFEHNYENYGLTPEDVKNGELQHSVGLNLDPEQENIHFKIRMTYSKTAPDTNKIKLLAIETEHIFKCPDFTNSFPSRTDDTIDIPPDFMVELLKIAFYGTRGMLFAQINNPEYKKIVFPLIDLSRILKNLYQKKKKA